MDGEILDVHPWHAAGRTDHQRFRFPVSVSASVHVGERRPATPVRQRPRGGPRTGRNDGVGGCRDSVLDRSEIARQEFRVPLRGGLAGVSAGRHEFPLGTISSDGRHVGARLGGFSDQLSPEQTASGPGLGRCVLFAGNGDELLRGRDDSGGHRGGGVGQLASVAPAGRPGATLRSAAPAPVRTAFCLFCGMWPPEAASDICRNSCTGWGG